MPKHLATALLALAVSACAMTPQQFDAARSTMSDQTLCVEVRSAVQSNDQPMIARALAESNLRRLTAAQCAVLWTKRDSEVAAGVGLLAAVALIAVAAKHGGGGGSVAAVQAVDYSWDWDLFYNEQRLLVWACRGIQTGQFAEANRCAGLLQVDRRWPGLAAPQ